MRAKVSEEIKQQVEMLFKKAQQISRVNDEEAQKIVKKARKIAKHANYRIPEEWRNKFCHKCNSWLETNRKVRLSKGKISIKCLKCGHVTRKKFKN
ncbi:MAG: hypothetical protein QXW65_01300 [Candidatus Pacearchaeota archaeon]